MCYHGYHRGRGMHREHFHGHPFQPESYSPPVNVVEDASGYDLYMAAPGRVKSEFKVSVNDDVLSISYQKPTETDTKARWIYHEFKQVSFERRFQLSNKADTANITADYTDGILHLRVPKIPGSGPIDQTVIVA